MRNKFQHDLKLPASSVKSPYCYSVLSAFEPQQKETDSVSRTNPRSSVLRIVMTPKVKYNLL